MRKLMVVIIGFFLALCSIRFAVYLNSSDGPEMNDQSSWRYHVYDPESGLIGYIDNMGNQVIPPRYDEGQDIFQKLGFVKVNDKYGYIDSTGELVIPTQFDDAEPFYDGMAIVEIDGKEGFINEKGEFIFNIDYFGFRSADGLAFVEFENDSWGFIDITGKLVVGPIKGDDLTCGLYSEGLLAVEREHKYGYMDKSGKIVIEPKFDNGSYFREGLAKVRIGKLYGYIDKSGKIIIKPQFDFANDFSEGVAAVGRKVNNSEKMEFFLINTQGKILVGPKTGWENVGLFSEGMAPVVINSKYGFINMKFNVVIEPKYDSVYEEFKGGLLYVVDEEIGLSGYIDKEGHWIWSLPKGRNLTFMFRDTSPEELVQTMESFGAISLERRIMFLSPDPVKTGEMASLAWVFPSKKDWLLLIGLEGDLVVAFISMTMDTISSWFALEDVLFPKASSSKVSSGIRSSAVLYMYVKSGQKAESALCEFAIYVLNEHPGIVADFYHGHAWTLKEIKEDISWNGIHFLRPHKKD